MFNVIDINFCFPLVLLSKSNFTPQLILLLATAICKLMPHTQTPNSIKNIYIGRVSATESEQLPTPINEEVLLIDGYSTDI